MARGRQGGVVAVAVREQVRAGMVSRLWLAGLSAVRVGGTGLLVAACAAFAVGTWRWRVVSDAALMHYVVMLQQHGWAPYRMVRDINLPGAYLPDWVAMRVAGTGWAGDVAWRVYDLGLLLVAAAAMVVIAWPVDWFAGVLGGALFALFHGRDGAGQAGQRDLAIAVLVLLGCAAMLAGLRRYEGDWRGEGDGTGGRWLRAPGWWRGGLGRAELWFGAGGLALGLAATVKPFGAGFLLVYLGWLVLTLRREGRNAAGPGMSMVAGFLLGPAMAGVYLVRAGAVGSFVHMCRVALPFHAAIARPPLGVLLVSGFPPSLVKLAGLALAAMLLSGSWRRRETQVALLGFGFGLSCFVLQQKGYSYQRYPYVALLLLWVAVEFLGALSNGRWSVRLVGLLGLGYAMACAPAYLRTALHSNWNEPYMEPMKRDLRAAAGGGGMGALNGRVQCIDTMSGCVDVLYRLGLEEATGTLYDEFLFPPLAAGAAVPRAVSEEQEAFLREFRAKPPKVVIVSPWLFTEGPGNYGKLARWPAVEGLLAGYWLVDERSYPRTENGPMGFRMYVRR